MIESKQIFNLDSTALRSSSCPQKFYNIVVAGLREKGSWNDTYYGVAFHKFLARMQESNGNFAEAVKAARKCFSNPAIKIKPKKEHLDEKHLIKTCLDYWDHDSLDKSCSLLINPIAKCWRCNGSGITEFAQPPDFEETICVECSGTGQKEQPMVEQTFSINAFEDDSIIINIQGTIDELGKIQNGCYVVSDYKTTSTWDISKYFRPYKLSPQLKLYVWAVRTLARQNPDGLLAPLAKQPIGARIKGIFLKSQQETVFENSEVFQYKENEMLEFEALLQIKIQHLAGLIKKTLLPLRLGMIDGTCMHPYGCSFFNLCAAQDDIVKKYLINSNYDIKPYRPLHFHDNE